MSKVQTTDKGHSFFTTMEISPNWSDFNKNTAMSHLDKYGCIFVSKTYNSPIFNWGLMNDILNYLNGR